MESAGLRRRQPSRVKNISQGIDTGPCKEADEDHQPPSYVINLSLPPSERYTHMARDFMAEISNMTKIFDEVVHDMLPHVRLKTVKWFAKIFLRRVHSQEETEELRGISKATGVDMYLLVSFNVLLDLFMGCTSGGALVREKSGAMKMLHFRTLDWGMDALRRIVVKLDFVETAGSPVIASSVTYFGFVGVLTGVKANLSMSLNFRPTHDASTWFKNAQFYASHLFVLLGLRQSISSILRQYLIPSSNPASARPTIAQIERTLPPIPTTAAYLIFSDGNRTTVVEKDHHTARTFTATDFIVALNHDIASEAPNPRSSESNPEHENSTLKTTGMNPIVASSTQRKVCIVDMWEAATRSRERRGLYGSTGPKFVTKGDIERWLGSEHITNAETHYATIMDPKAGKVLWAKRYLEMTEEEVEDDEDLDEDAAGESGEVEAMDDWIEANDTCAK